MAFKSLKNHISNLATPFLANVANNFVSKQGAKDAGKLAASLKQKSPFNIDPVSYTHLTLPTKA